MNLLVALLLAFTTVSAHTVPRVYDGRRTVVDPNCCSYNLKDCYYASKDANWCAMTWQNCVQCTGSWINPANRTTCIPLWGDCTSLPDSLERTVNDTCCGQSTCTRVTQWYKQCQPPQFCCSWDLASCGDSKWCNQNAQNCAVCGGVAFIEPATRHDCTPRWTDCVKATECCGGSVCQEKPDGSGWKYCDIPATPKPTTQPSSPPPTRVPVTTPRPTLSPTRAPTNFGPLPAGPFITVSSTRITIPNPANPVVSGRTLCPHLDTGILDWHVASTWGTSGVPVPTNFANLQLPANTRIVIRKPVVGIFGIITIPATSELIFGENATGITLDTRGMDVIGKLTAGSETCRLETPVTITLYGSRPANAVTVIPEKTYKGISVSGSISLHGKRYFRTWTRLAKSVAVGDRVMMVQNQVNWEPGQKIILVTTAMKDSREWHQNEVLTVRGVVANPATGVGAAVYVNETIKYIHVANSGYQAEVGLLTRTIKIQGSATDSEPTDPDPLNCTLTDRTVYNDKARPCPNTELTGFGGHVMVHSNGTGFVEGVQLYRMGQTNVLGRYPMHFHILGNCPTCYFRDSSVHRSFYRCVSVHGTNYLNVNENVAFDVTGYCYYLEDGVEHHNTISFNLAAHIHLLGPEPPWGGGQTTKLYQQSDILTLPADVTASGFYITNVQNNIIGNAASGGWSGFAFPNLPTPLGPHKDIYMRPSSALPLTINGNTAHSTGWWWYHAGAFYFGGSLYYNDQGVLEYNPGRDFDFGNHDRNTCLRDLCSSGDCGGWCPEYEQSWIRMTNTKAFLAPSVGLNSWSGRMEIVGFEAHDVGLSIEALEAGFWIDNMMVACRTGTKLALPTGASTSSMSGNGFTWYDTGQEHIITNSLFRNCGYRSQQYNQYDNTTTRGCGTDVNTGCASSSYVFGFLTHSDQFNPEVMQGTKNITFEQCGRRFSLDNWGKFLSVSGRTQNWLDTDGTVSGLRVPTLIGSGLVGAGLWWTVDNEVVHDTQGPLKFIKQTKERGLGSLTLYFDAAQHDQVGNTVCGNGDGLPCPPLGYIKHMGKKFSLDNGLPITASADVAGPVGGYSWLLKLIAGAPKRLVVNSVEVRPDTPMLLSIAYPPNTAFTITASAAEWCSPSAQYSCKEVFKPVDSIAAVRKSLGNTYFFSPQGLLTVRIIQTPKDYVGAPTWLLPQFNTTGQWSNGFAFPRFERGGVLLPVNSFGPWLDIVTNCPVSTNNSAYCSQLPPVLDPDVCPSGYTQMAYDKCCLATNVSTCVFADGSST